MHVNRIHVNLAVLKLHKRNWNKATVSPQTGIILAIFITWIEYTRQKRAPKICSYTRFIGIVGCWFASTPASCFLCRMSEAVLLGWCVHISTVQFHWLAVVCYRRSLAFVFSTFTILPRYSRVIYKLSIYKPNTTISSW